MKAVAALALAALLLCVAAPAHADDFYQGKTLTIVVGYTAGGGYDINARLVSRHIGRHIPGAPNVVVVNMPGAGSLRSLEHLERARAEGRHRHRPVRLHPDHQLAADARQGPDRLPQVQMDRQRRSRIWRSATSGTRSMRRRSRTCSACRRSTWAAPIPARPPTPSSASCASCSTSMCIRSPAIAGSAEGFIAVERGELEGGCMTWASLPPHWIADNKITPIMRVTSATAPDLPAGVPSAARPAGAGSRPASSARAVGRRRGRQAAGRAAVGAGRARARSCATPSRRW